MKFTLVDNAVDSLKIAIAAFSTWNQSDDEEEDRALKVTVLFLHNAVELIIKAILINDDEVSIYSAKQEEIITKAKIESAIEGIELDEYLIKEKNIKTESYSVLVEKYLDKIDHGVKTKGYLERLGTYRNSIAHFGINNEDRGTGLLDVIHGTFKVILEDFYDDLLKIDDYFSYNDVLDFLEPWCEESEEVIRELAITESDLNICDFLAKMKKVIYSDKMQNFMRAYNIEFEDNSNYDKNDINLVYKCEERKVEFNTTYDAFYNYTVFYIYAFEYPMVFVIMHYESRMCIFDNQPSYDEYRLEAISNKTLDKQSHIKSVTEKNIRDAIVNALRKNVLCNR